MCAGIALILSIIEDTCSAVALAQVHAPPRSGVSLTCHKTERYPSSVGYGAQRSRLFYLPSVQDTSFREHIKQWSAFHRGPHIDLFDLPPKAPALVTGVEAKCVLVTKLD